MKLQQIRQLAKLIPESSEKTNIDEKDYRVYMDPTCVFGIIPKTLEFKTVLETQFESDTVDVPKLKYDLYEPVSSFSIDYLKKVLEFVKLSNDEKVKIKIGNDYPLWIETSEYIIILAPRVDV